jgi:hypothetical protein
MNLINPSSSDGIREAPGLASGLSASWALSGQVAHGCPSFFLLFFSNFQFYLLQYILYSSFIFQSIPSRAPTFTANLLLSSSLHPSRIHGPMSLLAHIGVSVYGAGACEAVVVGVDVGDMPAAAHATSLSNSTTAYLALAN